MGKILSPFPAALKPLKNVPFDADLEHDILSVLEPFLLELTSRGAFVVQNGGPGYSVDIGSIDGAIKVSVGLALIKPDELVGLTVTI